MGKIYSEVATSFSLEAGYGREMARGAGRFRIKRPDWLFVHHPMAFFDRNPKISGIGGIGHFFSDEHLDLLKRNNVPYLVSISGRADPGIWFRVIPDNQAIGKMAAEYFIKKSYQHFAYLVLDIPFAVERAEGFLNHLNDRGFHDVAGIHPDSIAQFQRDAISLPLALFVPIDSAALSLMKRLAFREFRVPEDISILGVDNDEMASTFAPVPLSSIQLPYEEIGFSACEVLERMIETGKQEFGTLIRQPIGVVERRSTEAQSVKDSRVRKAQTYMADNLRDLEDVEALAGKLNMNRRTLDRLFVQKLGVSPAEWLLQRRTEYAERLLIETDYTVDYVAELAGFVDRRRLYRAFKSKGRPLPRVLRGMKRRGLEG